MLTIGRVRKTGNGLAEQEVEVDNLSVSLCAVAEQEEEGAVGCLEGAVEGAVSARMGYKCEKGLAIVSVWPGGVGEERLLAYLEMRAGMRVSKGFRLPLALAPDIS